jgi:hypothetical protein
MNDEVKLGTYQHYKGNYYEVLGVAKHTENLEELVVYKDGHNGQLWVRPLAMFLETVEIDGMEIPRFIYKELE